MTNFSSVDAGGSANPAEAPSSRPKAWTTVAPSEFVNYRANPIREIVDNIQKQPRNLDKELLSLSIGDPTVYGNLLPPNVLTDAIVRNVRSMKHNGYLPAVGSAAARAAIAQTESSPSFPVTKDDVVLTNGCLGAIQMAMWGLAGRGENILVPRPGFPVYEVTADAHNIEFRYYDLLPEKNWEADLAQMEAQIDSNTRAILINNPSNPCGSVYSKEHLEAILRVAEANKVPIIADEIYGDMAFGANQFHPIGSLSTTVPVVTLGGLAKHFLVPGWRIGWLVVHDRNGVLARVKEAFLKLAQLTFAPNSLAESIVPELLTPTPGSDAEKQISEFKKSYFATLEANAVFAKEAVDAIPGLELSIPQGAMYAMIKIDTNVLRGFKDDIDFAKRLIEEESVVVLPGQCFTLANYFRIVVAPPPTVLREAFARIADFCHRHATK